jgi:hypothetical protein
MERCLNGDSTRDSEGGSSHGESGSKIPTLKAWEGSRVKMVGLDALPTYKRVVAWFPGLVEDMECYLQQPHKLKWGTGYRPLENLGAHGGT